MCATSVCEVSARMGMIENSNTGLRMISRISNARRSLIRWNTRGHIRSEGEVRPQAGNCLPVWDISRVPVVPGIPGYSVEYHSDGNGTQ